MTNCPLCDDGWPRIANLSHPGKFLHELSEPAGMFKCFLDEEEAKTMTDEVNLDELRQAKTPLSDHIARARKKLLSGEWRMILEHPNPSEGSSYFPPDVAREIGKQLDAATRIESLTRERDTLRINRDGWEVDCKDHARRAEAAEAQLAEARKVIESTKGYMMNVLIDLQTRTKKETTADTVRGGIKIIDAFLTKGADNGK